MDGWFSTNILGNRDGEVLDEPQNFRDQGGVKARRPWSTSFSRINIRSSTPMPTTRSGSTTIPPRGDDKEGWDTIDLFGWLGRRMQLKVNFLCSDSALAAPLALDLVLFMDLAQRAGLAGIQEWLSFYFKSPHHAPSVYPEHDLFHPADQAQEHPQVAYGRGANHSPGHGIL